MPFASIFSFAEIAAGDFPAAKIFPSFIAI